MGSREPLPAQIDFAASVHLWWPRNVGDPSPLALLALGGGGTPRAKANLKESIPFFEIIVFLVAEFGLRTPHLAPMGTQGCPGDQGCPGAPTSRS